MKTITVAQLRQNPTAALDDVEAGQTYVVTRHRRAVAQLVPPEAGDRPTLTPPRKTGGASLAHRPPHGAPTVESVDAVLEDLKGEW
ncbi:MAG: type II toxin-antitoxin system Phd/YefM family antitoxin [Aeromicrobium sp.]|uniref:type II toxin-antitoxin system Phd/YefM family antitoxin n=1 Tax=Aeromicrobium sp. TaxID=1871063 RepID=UPI0039E6948B